jgi:hypothetical protein
VKLMRKFPLLPPDRRPQDPNLDGAGLIFEALDHGGEYPDTMPQAIRLTDAQMRWVGPAYTSLLPKTEKSSTLTPRCSRMMRGIRLRSIENAARCGGLAERTYQGAGVLELRRDRLRGRGTTERAGKADIRTTVP